MRLNQQDRVDTHQYYSNSCSTRKSAPLSLIYASFMSVCQKLQMWEHAAVTPIFESGGAAECNNYRPVFLTCISCKITKKIVASEVLRYLQVINII